MGIKSYNSNFSDTCSIPDGDSVLLTGGFNSVVDCPSPGEVSSKVHRYTQDLGWVEDLPDLKDGRYGHGCASFTMDAEQVTDHRSSEFILAFFQIYLVAGGCGQWQFDLYCLDVQCLEILASTEVYLEGKWITVEPLPVGVVGVRGATLDNTVYMTGSYFRITEFLHEA